MCVCVGGGQGGEVYVCMGGGGPRGGPRLRRQLLGLVDLGHESRLRSKPQLAPKVGAALTGSPNRARCSCIAGSIPS